MLSAIISGTPIWVWPLLLLLILIGFRARRSRTAPVALFYLLPLMGILSVRSVSALPAAQTVWIFFGITYFIGGYGGFIFQRKRIISKFQGRVTLKGEWLTLTVLMIIFWMRFAGGMIEAIGPETYASFSFHIVFASLAGLVAGTFIGRAICLLRAPSAPSS